MDVILRIICAHFKIPISQIFAKTRKRETIYYRQLLFFLARKKIPELSLNKIGAYFSNYSGFAYHHATVLHSIKVIEDLYTVDKTVFDDVIKLQEKIDRVLSVEYGFLKDKHPLEIGEVNLIEHCFKEINTNLL